MVAISRVTATLADHTARSGKKFTNTVLDVLMNIATLPYYRYFHFNTLAVINRVALCSSDPDKFPQLLQILVRWRERKLQELQFISIACTVLAGAVIGSFSWQFAENAYWLSSACWYSSLVLSVLGILLAAQQIAVLGYLGALPRHPSDAEADNATQRYLPLMLSTASVKDYRLESEGTRRRYCASKHPSRKMIFVWQCPVMFMSYSVCLFLLGLTLLVLTPLMRVHSHGWTEDANIAVIYIVMAALSSGTFMFCSYWVYHFVDIDLDVLLMGPEIVSESNGDGEATMTSLAELPPTLRTPG